MQYGKFDDSKREYIITDPRTPVKWINYIGTLAFGGFVDHTGGALICKGDPALNRITRYVAQLPASEFKGETLYLRVRTAKEFHILSPFFVPGLTPYQQFECHVGLGYNRIITEVEGIRTEATIFVPIDGSCEVRDIRITNLGKEAIVLDAIPVVDFTHFDALKQFTNADWVPQTMQCKVHREVDGEIVISQYAFMKRDVAENFFTSNLPPSSFETDRRKFLGANEYGTWTDPLSLHKPDLPNSESTRGDNIAALLQPLGSLQPGETRRLITLLGQQANYETARTVIEKYRQPQNVDLAFKDLSAFWDKLLSVQQVKTPDPALNSMLNIHNPHQCYTTLNWSRYLSLYQLGYGERGIGFRDSSQDTMGVMTYQPKQALDLIRMLLQVQKRDGSAMHQFNPLSMVASVGDSAEQPDRPHFYSDDHLWGILAVAEYLKETGDMHFLDERLPYYEKDARGIPLAVGSVLDHLVRGIEFTRTHIGEHGLPLLGFADWNDTMNLPNGSESCFTACLYGKALLEMIAISKFRDDSQSVFRLQKAYEDMKASFQQSAWDGEWFISYFDQTGAPIGSHTNTYGQIYAYTQAWPVIAGFATPEQTNIALESVHQKLNTRNGVKLSTPGFNGFDPKIGGTSTYPPGAKENGGIFLHVNPWVILAETLNGNAERAYRYYAQINPASKNDKIDEYEVEPYVYAQNILADEHPLFGLGRNSWLSGTASWMMQVGVQAILGVRVSLDGLVINPCIPSAWDQFEVSRVFRGVRYQIHIQNPKHVSKGVDSLKVNGNIISGNVVPMQKNGPVHVEVVLG